jgi:hypothetical protein
MAQAIQHALSRIPLGRIDVPAIAESVALSFAKSGIRMSWVRVELALLIGAFIMAA